MAQMMSPGVKVNEIDLSIIVPMLGSSTACFAGEFSKGPSDKYMLITNVQELIDTYGYPTNSNYNDWFSCYNFLQYSDKLLISRAVDSNGTFEKTDNRIKAINELGKIELMFAPKNISIGTYVKFNINQEKDYKVLSIEPPKDAIKQVDTLTIDTFASNVEYSVTIDGNKVSYVSSEDDDVNKIANYLGHLLEKVDVTSNNIKVRDNEITITSSIAGIPTEIVNNSNTIMTLKNVVENSEGSSDDSWELVFEEEYGELIDFQAMPEAVFGSNIFAKKSALNAIATIPSDGESYDNASDLKLETIFVPNEDEFEIMAQSIRVRPETKLKFIAKSSGSEMNGISIAIARESDFLDGDKTVFDGLYLNDFFEYRPIEAKREIAVLIAKDGVLVSNYIVSLSSDSKDYRKKSNYIESVINKYDSLVYVIDNSTNTKMPKSTLWEKGADNLAYTSNGSDGEVNVGDIEMALGSYSDSTLFGNKEELDIDIIIANEKARVQSGVLATERADCIAFIGAKFEDVVGLKSNKIVENLIKDVQTGEINSANTANSYNAYFGNYKQQYDKFSDKTRWVSVVGDVAGLRADVNSKLDSWWASAGLDRGQIKNALRIAFNPNSGQRDMLYKNKINPIVNFPGQGNAIVWGQKTLQSKASAFDRINVRGLFNTLERSISRMAKYYLFEFNDSFTRNRFIGTIKPFLDNVKAGRGIYDYHIRCDETNNTPAIIDSNNFVADIAIKPTRVAEFIQLNFIAVGTGVEFNEIFI